MSDKIYKVGYKKPPKHTQFKPGQSGNPKGLGKRDETPKTVFKEEMAERFPITRKGKTVRVSALRIAMKRAKVKAMEGDLKAFALLLRLCERWGLDEAKEALAQELQPDDAGIIKRALRRLTDEDEDPPPDAGRSDRDDDDKKEGGPRG